MNTKTKPTAKPVAKLAAKPAAKPTAKLAAKRCNARPQMGTYDAFLKIARDPLAAAFAAARAARDGVKAAEKGYFVVVAQAAYDSQHAPSPEQLAKLARELGDVTLKASSARTLASNAGAACRLATNGIAMPDLASAKTQSGAIAILAHAVAKAGLKTARGRPAVMTFEKHMEGATPAGRAQTRKVLQGAAAAFAALSADLGKVPALAGMAQATADLEAGARAKIGTIDEVTAKQGRAKSE